MPLDTWKGSYGPYRSPCCYSKPVWLMRRLFGPGSRDEPIRETAGSAADKPDTSSDAVSCHEAALSPADKPGSSSDTVSDHGAALSHADKPDTSSDTVSDHGAALSHADKPDTSSDTVSHQEAALSPADEPGTSSNTVCHQEAAPSPADKPDTSCDTDSNGDATLSPADKPDSNEEATLSPANTVIHEEAAASTAAEQVLTNPMYLPYQPTFELADVEKDGNIYDLPFFGQRTYDGCYVDAKSVGDMLGLGDHFRMTLACPESKYVPGVHFAYIPFRVVQQPRPLHPQRVLGLGAADRSIGNQVRPAGPLVKGEYFDLQPLSAFADFRNGPAVSTGRAGLLIQKLLGGWQVQRESGYIPGWTAGKAQYFDLQPLSAFSNCVNGPVGSTFWWLTCSSGTQGGHRCPALNT